MTEVSPIFGHAFWQLIGRLGIKDVSRCPACCPGGQGMTRGGQLLAKVANGKSQSHNNRGINSRGALDSRGTQDSLAGLDEEDVAAGFRFDYGVDQDGGGAAGTRLPPLGSGAGDGLDDYDWSHGGNSNYGGSRGGSRGRSRLSNNKSRAPRTPKVFPVWHSKDQLVDTKDCTRCRGTGEARRALFTFDEELYFSQLSLPTLPSSAGTAAAAAAAAAEGSQPQFAWSPEAQPLQKQLAWERTTVKKMLRRPRPKGVKLNGPRDHRFVRNVFRTIRLPSSGLTTLDEELAYFDKLEMLTLSGNDIRVVENLPRSLRALNAYGNQIEAINGPRDYDDVAQLMHAGLGYNALSSIAELLPFASTLLSLDLSFNNIESLAETVQLLPAFTQLHSLYLQGNPLALNRHYRLAIIQAAPWLRQLDGQPVENTDEVISRVLRDAQMTVKAQVEAEVAGETRDPEPEERKEPTRGRRGRGRKGGRGRATAKRAASPASIAQQEKIATLTMHRLAKIKQDLEPTEDSISQPVVLRLRVDKLEGLPVPNSAERAAQAQVEAAAHAASGHRKKGSHAGGNRGKKGGKDRAAHEDLEAAEQARAADEPVTLSSTSEQRVEHDQDSDQYTQVTVTTTVVRKSEFFVHVRLEGDCVLRSAVVPWSKANSGGVFIDEVIVFNPSVSWRNFFQVMGIDVLVFQRDTTTTEVKTVRMPMAQPPEDEQEFEGAAAAAAAAGADKSRKRRGGAVDGGKNKRKGDKRGGNRLTKAEEQAIEEAKAAAEAAAVVETSTTVEDQLVGFAPFSTEAVLDVHDIRNGRRISSNGGARLSQSAGNPAEQKSEDETEEPACLSEGHLCFTQYKEQAPLSFVSIPESEQWDAINERRLPRGFSPEDALDPALKESLAASDQKLLSPSVQRETSSSSGTHFTLGSASLLTNKRSSLKKPGSAGNDRGISLQFPGSGAGDSGRKGDEGKSVKVVIGSQGAAAAKPGRQMTSVRARILFSLNVQDIPAEPTEPAAETEDPAPETDAEDTHPTD